MAKGQSFLSDVDESKHRHLRIVISNSDVNNCFLTVPVIHWYEDRPSCDNSCIIVPGEHSFIVDKSCIDYRHAEIFSFVKIFNGIQKGIFIRKEDVSAVLLRRIQDGARKTKFLPNKFKVFFDLF